MKTTEFLRERKIVAEDKSDLIIGFDNGTKESLSELLESFHKVKSEEESQIKKDLVEALEAMLNVFEGERYQGELGYKECQEAKAALEKAR